MTMLQNRDLSWLDFNFRVLQEAGDKRVPLFERLRFLSIFSSNLDEFFRVRYPSVLALSKLSSKTRSKASVEAIDDIAERIQSEVNRQLGFFGAILEQQLIPALKDKGIVFYYHTPFEEDHVGEMNELFLSHLLSFIQPIFLEGDMENPFVPENNQLYFVVTLKEAGDSPLKQAIVNIPSNKLKRFFTLSPINGNEYVVFADDIVRENLHLLFPKFEILSSYSIKFNRDAELRLEEEYSGDLLNKIEKQIKKRDIGPPSRFLYETGMPHNLQLFLSASFHLKYEDMFAGGRYHNLSDLSSFPVFDKDLLYPKFKPIASRPMKGGDIFRVLEKKDVLLHLPYESYNPVLSFFNQSAVDAEVTDIYITLYRVASESHIINALISAAKNGKNVVAFIELKARFDEANNIKWSRVMKDAGVKLVYSLPQIKVHSKTALVIRKKAEGEKAYAVFSTGNFNEVTAQFYTDHVLMTTDRSFTDELVQLFDFLQKGNIVPGDAKIVFNDLLVSQFNLVDSLRSLINGEIKKIKKGLPAAIRIKVNNLEEPGMINLLYKASKAGVPVQLIVRSVNCLVAGSPGVSDNISIHRIVDRFLEHSRLFIFGTDDDATVLMGSADLMTRNLYHRIEVCFPVKDPVCKKAIIEYFNVQWENLENAQRSIYEYLKKQHD
jgi:polyphosphate kinase